MTQVYYKNLAHTTKEEREKLIERAEDYLEQNRYVNTETGEILYNYPSVFKDSQKMRRKKAEQKLSNPNSQTSRLFRLLENEAYFYTVNLADIHPSWGEYENIFDPAKVKKIKSWIARMIKGPYSAAFELCAFSGAHVHVVSERQTHKLLKAETKVWEEFGLTKYLSKSSFSLKDKYQNNSEYLVMLGKYLEWRSMMGRKRLPKRSWMRLNASGSRKKKD